MDDAKGDSWSASALSVRETLRERIGDAPDASQNASDSRQRADAAVATVTGVEGSAYRRPGAKRVVADEAVGAITAGCLEGPVADLAERITEEGPLLETFDLTGDDETWNFGLGCNGVIDVLVEPADESFRPALERVERGDRIALLTVVGGDHPAPVGARALADGDPGDGATDAEETPPRPAIPDDLLAAVEETAREFAETGRSDTVTVETDRGTGAIFVDGLEPAPELLVFGSDADVRPVVRLARDAGFRVTVAAARGARADAERFPEAHRVVSTHPSELADAVARPADTYAVLMSHNFVDDRLALASLLETDVPYVGMMGPRKRFEQLRDALADEGTRLSEGDLDRISTPVGLDLGGGEPMQIALSVVSEVLAVSNGRDGGRLARGEGPIHPRPGAASDSS